MKICVFIDGQNFYRSLLRFDEALRVDYDKLARWITQAVGGSPATFAGAYYYVGVSADAPALVEGFLKGLELRPGYFVKREPRVRRSGRCSACGATYEYTTEKRVDTRLVADLIQLAANDDFVPAVEAVNALGKQVWVATWSADELSKDLRVRCFGEVHLSDGIAAFRAERARGVDRERLPGLARTEGRVGGLTSRLQGRPSTGLALERGLAELQRAEARLPHVSRGYFVTRWRSHQLPPAGQEREALVQQMIEAGVCEEFEATDADGRSVRAIRSRAATTSPEGVSAAG